MTHNTLSHKIIQYIFKPLSGRDKNHGSVNIRNDSEAQPPAVDIIESIRLTKGNSDLAKDMLIMLATRLDDTQKKISECYQAGNLATLEYEVHQLHGACCYCGVPGLRNASAALESRLHEQKQGHNDIHSRVKILLTEIERVLQWVNDHDINGEIAKFNRDDPL
jgi:two-component system, NarL family, sensor histidine kinase BarA